jgi:hypothetical protein
VVVDRTTVGVPMCADVCDGCVGDSANDCCCVGMLMCGDCVNDSVNNCDVLMWLSLQIVQSFSALDYFDRRMILRQMITIMHERRRKLIQLNRLKILKSKNLI